jgi:hypothetical protein
MPTLEYAEDDLVLIIPRDRGTSGVRVMVGFEQVGLLQEILVSAGVDGHIVVRARWPSPMGPTSQWVDSQIPVRTAAFQRLLAPWTGPLTTVQEEAILEPGPTLWERLSDS